MQIFHFSDWWLTPDWTLKIFAFSERLHFRRKANLEELPKRGISKSGPSDRRDNPAFRSADGGYEAFRSADGGRAIPQRKIFNFHSSVNYFIIYEPSVAGGGRVCF